MKRKSLCGILLLFFIFPVNAINTEDEKVKEEVWNTVKTINYHWAVTENMDSLGLFIHPDMVIIFPGGKVEGKESVIEAYRHNATENETIQLEEKDPSIQLYNNDQTAVVIYSFYLQVKNRAGQIHTFCCRDMYTLVRESDRWMAVAQYYSFMNCPE